MEAAPQTDLTDPIVALGLELVTDTAGVSRAIRHYVLASGPQREHLDGKYRWTERRSWHGPWVSDVRGCGNAVPCSVCRAEWRLRAEARRSRGVG